MPRRLPLVVPIPVFYYTLGRRSCGLGAYTAPVPGPVSSGFGPRPAPLPGASTDHPGMDYAVPVGTPVVSPAAGVVTFAGVQTGFGNTVQVDYGGGFQATYGHLSQILVGVGQSVAPGDVLGLSGNTGLTTGPHLHFQVSLNGSPVDPAGWLAAGAPQLASPFLAAGSAPAEFADVSGAGGIDPVLAAIVAGVTGVALAVALS